MKQMIMNLALFLPAWLLKKTYRIRYFEFDYRAQAHAHHPARATAIALWHGHSFVGSLSHAHQRIAPLVSQSPDGQMVAFLCRRIGLQPVNGSSSRGGKEARNQLEEAISRGISPAITVDGPKGPRGVSKNGIIDIARKTGAAILPLIALGDRYWQLGSWDRLCIPKPFARIAVCYGPPIKVPADVKGENFEALRQRLDRELQLLETKALNCLQKWAASTDYRTATDVIKVQTG